MYIWKGEKKNLKWFLHLIRHLTVKKHGGTGGKLPCILNLGTKW